MGNSQEKLLRVLKTGGVAVAPTDTIYGILGQALNRETVERIYRIKGRNPAKPFIVLVSSLSDLDSLGIETKEEVKKFWPGPVSVILAFKKNTKKKSKLLGDAIREYEYLHRSTESLAFRMPKDRFLIDLLEKTGPLVAPSANPEGEKPATNIKKARQYFGTKVDYYFDGGEKAGNPSRIIDLRDEEKVIRG